MRRERMDKKIVFKKMGTPQESRLTRQWQYVSGLSKYQYEDWTIKNPCGYWDVYKGHEMRLHGCSYKEAREFVINEVNKQQE